LLLRLYAVLRRRTVIRKVGRGGGFRAAARVLAAVSIAFMASATVLADGTRDVDPENDATGVDANDPSTSAARRAFERRVNQAYAWQLARIEARDGSSVPPSPEASGGGTPSEEAPGLSDTPRLRLGGVLDRMSVSTGWQVRRNAWRAGIQLRFSRSVEFDPATHSYALLEAIELTPAAAYRFVALARAMKVIVRRTGYGTWEEALFARPSHWLFGDRPNRTEEAQQLAPGTTVTVSNETKLFVGADVSTHVGAFPLKLHAGPVASGEAFARLEHLAKSAETLGDREWVVSVGGLIPRGFETAMSMRTPDLVFGRSVRLLEAHWRESRGARFLLRAGPLDLRGNPEAVGFLRTAMAGVAPFRFFDVPLLGANLKTVGRHAEVGPNLLKRLERFPNFKRLLAAAHKDPNGIPYVESISRFAPRTHGESGLGLWAGPYGLNLTSNWYAEESLGAPSGRPSSMIFSYPMQRRWDRGWLFFPRETQDLQMITVQDGQGEDLITEVSLEIEDAHAHRRESRVYREQVLSFITKALVEKFPQRTEPDSSSGPREIHGELPDLAHAPEKDERVSIYLRIILGPRFHERLLLGAKDAKDQKRRITEWQKRMSTSIRRRGDTIEELVRTCGEEDLFVSFRIALTPYARRKETPRPTTVFTGAFGDPQKIESYRRLRDAFDAAGTIF
jgi:hypothetical protein